MNNDNSGEAKPKRRAVYIFLSVWGLVVCGSLTIELLENKTPILLLGIEFLYYLGAVLALTGLILYKKFSIKGDREFVVIYFIVWIPFLVFLPKLVGSLFKRLEMEAFISILILALIAPVASFFRNVYIKDYTSKEDV